MPKFTVITGSIKANKKLHHPGDELELSVEEAARINAKGLFVELTETHAAKAKAQADAKAAIEKAEKEAAAKLEAAAKQPKGGGK